MAQTGVSAAGWEPTNAACRTERHTTTWDYSPQRLTFQSVSHGKSAMRQSIRSTASSGTTTSSAPQRMVQVVLLNKEQLTVYIEGKPKLKEVFHQVCEHLSLRETEYFGLAQLIDEEYHFVDLETKLHKLVGTKTWKNCSTGGGRDRQRQMSSTSIEDRHVLTLYFRVQYYVEHVGILRERLTRQLYYLQLKDNLLYYKHQYSDDKCFLLAAYALQADIGSYNPQLQSHYFDPREYFPAWIFSKWSEEYILHNVPSMHRDLCSLTNIEAQMKFIRDTTQRPMAHNLHFYRLKKRKADTQPTAWLGICAEGIQIYDEPHGFKFLLSTFTWTSIGKLYYDKKKFEIRSGKSAGERKFTYYTTSDEQSKYLLSLCEETHRFHMAIQPRLAEIRVMEAEDKRFRETYVANDLSERSLSRNNTGKGHGSANSTLQLARSANLSNVSSMAQDSVRMRAVSNLSGSAVGIASNSQLLLSQRVSIISTNSSNTTSGIVSDSRLHGSFEESEDDKSQEIIINSPPLSAAPYKEDLHAQNYHVSPLANNVTYPVSRSNSNQSQKSNKQRFALLRGPQPADMQLQKMTLAPSMTVSSTPVPSGVVGPIISGVATTTAYPTRPSYTNSSVTTTIPSVATSIQPIQQRPHYMAPVANVETVVPGSSYLHNSREQHGLARVGPLCTQPQGLVMQASAVPESNINEVNTADYGTQFAQPVFPQPQLVTQPMLSYGQPVASSLQPLVPPKVQPSVSRHHSQNRQIQPHQQYPDDYSPESAPDYHPPPPPPQEYQQQQHTPAPPVQPAEPLPAQLHEAAAKLHQDTQQKQFELAQKDQELDQQIQLLQLLGNQQIEHQQLEQQQRQKIEQQQRQQLEQQQRQQLEQQLEQQQRQQLEQQQRQQLEQQLEQQQRQQLEQQLEQQQRQQLEQQQRQQLEQQLEQQQRQQLEQQLEQQQRQQLEQQQRQQLEQQQRQQLEQQQRQQLERQQIERQQIERQQIERQQIDRQQIERQQIERQQMEQQRQQIEQHRQQMEQIPHQKQNLIEHQIEIQQRQQIEQQRQLEQQQQQLQQMEHQQQIQKQLEIQQLQLDHKKKLNNQAVLQQQAQLLQHSQYGYDVGSEYDTRQHLQYDQSYPPHQQQQDFNHEFDLGQQQNQQPPYDAHYQFQVQAQPHFENPQFNDYDKHYEPQPGLSESNGVPDLTLGVPLDLNLGQQQQYLAAMEKLIQQQQLQAVPQPAPPQTHVSPDRLKNAYSEELISSTTASTVNPLHQQDKHVYVNESSVHASPTRHNNYNHTYVNEEMLKTATAYEEQQKQQQSSPKSVPVVNDPQTSATPTPVVEQFTSADTNTDGNGVHSSLLHDATVENAEGTQLNTPEKPPVNGLPTDHNNAPEIICSQEDLTDSSTNQRCPKHGNLRQEINDTSTDIPFLKALVNDKSLDCCNCNGLGLLDKSKRLSYSHPPGCHPLNEPGTSVRPVSWHSENFSQDMTMRVSEGLKLGGVVNGMFLGHECDNKHHTKSLVPDLQNNTIHPLVPSRITSGGHSPTCSSEAMQQNAGVGMA